MLNGFSPRGTSLLSIASALVTYRSATGTPQVTAVAWVGIVCTNPALLTVALMREGNPRQGLCPGGSFAVNLPSEENLPSLPFLESLEWSDTDLTLTEGELSGVPLIAECPVHIECRRSTAHDSFGRNLVRGEVAIVHMEGVAHGVARAADLRRLNPFAYSPRFTLPTLRGCRPGGQA